MAMATGMGGVEVERVVMQGQRGEGDVVALGQRTAQMMLEDPAGLEILVAVTTGKQLRPGPEIIGHVR